MATTFLKPLHTGKGRSVAQALERSTDYVKNPDKTDGGEWISSYQCNPDIVDSEFLFSKRQYEAATGKTQKDKDVVAYHLRQSFKPGEVTPELANKIGYDLAMSLTKGRHAFIVCTHVDKHHIHSHIIFNSTSLDCTRKFQNFWGSSMAVRRISDLLCLENGLSVIKEPKSSRGCYGTWLGDQKAPTVRSQLEKMIDTALAGGSKNYEDFLAAMQTSGAEIRTGKHLAFRIPGGQRFIRCDSLSENYTENAILERLEGKKPRLLQAQPPNEKSNDAVQQPLAKSVSEPPAFYLLIDLQKKMAQANSPGYERWAKTYNLKEMAKTMLYLKEHDLADYEKLSAACADASQKYDSLSDQTKANSARLKEITELEKQIGAYGKTREIYAQYLQLPKGKQSEFYETHRAELAVHEAAKKYFDSLGLKKLQGIKALKQEYAELSAQNKQLYPKQKQARAEMIELLRAKSNVERFLDIQPEEEKKKSKQQMETR